MCKTRIGGFESQPVTNFYQFLINLVFSLEFKNSIHYFVDVFLKCMFGDFKRNLYTFVFASLTDNLSELSTDFLSIILEFVLMTRYNQKWFNDTLLREIFKMTIVEYRYKKKYLFNTQHHDIRSNRKKKFVIYLIMIIK